jgi:hypothetical protein
MVGLKVLFKNLMLIAVITIMTGCEPLPEIDASVRIINRSNEDIIWTRYYGSDMPSSYPWGDKTNEDVILKDSIGYHYFVLDAVKTNINNTRSMKYYIWTYDSVKTIPWQRICDEHIVLKVVIFNSWEDMGASNFTITYP